MKLNLQQFVSIKTSRKRSGFALIYTMLFVMLIVVTVLVSWATAMADIRLQSRNQYSTEAYQLARAAVEEGFLKYKSEIGTNLNIPAVTFPVASGTLHGGCGTAPPGNSTNPGVHLVYPNNDTKPNPENVNLTTVPLVESKNGFYAYRVCASAGSSTKVGAIEGIGYYKGTKVTLKADVNHRDQPIPNPPDPLYTQTGWNHTNDTMFIYQAGPSG